MSIIEFSLENFRIFNKKVVFSMFAKKSKHTFNIDSENLLKTSLIYGPNASGKSSLLKALLILRDTIINSANNSDEAILRYQPFLLSSEEDKPVFYEIIFSLDKKVFKYNFSILGNEFVTENLFEILSSSEEKKYLIRKKQDIKLFSDFEKSKDIAEKTRKDVLFLSSASQQNSELAMQIIEGFKNINVINGLDSEIHRGYTAELLKEDEEEKQKVLDFLKKADFGIEDCFIEKIKIPKFARKKMKIMGAKDVPDEIDTLFLTHNKYDFKGNKIGTEKFNLGDESMGTQRFFDMIGPIIDTLEGGKILFIDEFDNSLHPYLTKLIINLFEKNNPENAQLVVVTHDTTLLSNKELNKEQFWFTEKDKFGAGNLFSLSEFKFQKNDIEFSKKYLEGRFGAIPFIDFLN